MFSYPVYGARGFHPKLANELATVRHSDWMLASDMEDVSVPPLAAWFGIWAAMLSAPGANCTSRPLPPPRPPWEEGDLCALMVVERVGREAVFGSRPLPNGPSPRWSSLSRTGALPGLPGGGGPAH